MKFKEYQEWYKKLHKEFKELQKIKKKRMFTQEEYIRYVQVLDNIDYIYRCNGYT